jgi:hypothetical protein
MRQRVAAGAALATAAGVALAVLGLAHGQQVHRNGFEARDTSWLKGKADAAFQETAHDISEETAHTGQFSEHIRLTAEPGSFIHYYYPTGRAPVSDESSFSIWVKANRPGVQLLARVVLPKERSATSLDEPLTALVRGDTYQLVGRWQRLELRRPAKLAQQQQQLMQAELKRPVDFTEAYVDQLVLNLHAGPGLTEVWIDDLEVGPVVEAPPFQATSRPVNPDPAMPDAPPRVQGRGATVELSQDHLLVAGKRFFFRGIRHSDTPLKALRDAGFNTVWVDYASQPGLLEEAVNLGLWVVPSLPVGTDDTRLSMPEGLTHEVSRFLVGDAVLFWDLGGGLTAEQAAALARAAQTVRAADPQRPIGADVWDGFLPFSRNLDLLGTHRWPLMTGLELPQYREWLSQRRRLARPGTFCWTWVQTHLPEWYTQLVYDRPASTGFAEPVGPQPEQIRLLAYTAVAAGYRGIGFWSDRYLADTHQGRDRLLALALINQELQMLEPLLLSALGPPEWIDTSNGEVKAAVLRTAKGVLVLPIWMGAGAQFVPGQAAAAQLSMVVPRVPVGTQAWLISPGQVRCLPPEQRVVGGTRITIPEFGVTAAVLFTGDLAGTINHFEEQSRRMAKQAAQWAHDLAEVEADKVLRVEAELERTGHVEADGRELQADVQRRLRLSVEAYNNGHYQEAYLEAQRAVRPLRILMRAQWKKATDPPLLTTPVASPYAVSFFTLPRHWEFMDQVRAAEPGTNLLPEGDFERDSDRVPSGWSVQAVSLDEVDLQVKRATEEPKEGRQCLQLEIKAKAPPGAGKDAALAPVALERTFLAVHTPALHLQPGTLVRVSGWVRIPKPIAASVDGALLYDSAGGEPLAVRLTGSDPGWKGKTWKKFTLYRKVPASGTIHVTMALTGLGKAYFDDIRVEPLLPGTKPTPPLDRPAVAGPVRTPAPTTPASRNR